MFRVLYNNKFCFTKLVFSWIIISASTKCCSVRMNKCCYVWNCATNGSRAIRNYYLATLHVRETSHVCHWLNLCSNLSSSMILDGHESIKLLIFEITIFQSRSNIIEKYFLSKPYFFPTISASPWFSFTYSGSASESMLKKVNSHDFTILKQLYWVVLTTSFQDILGKV